jgi:peptidylprolyl isomerase/FKBP-type peptidyl-prolyl cis-trans isomerase FklB
MLKYVYMAVLLCAVSILPSSCSKEEETVVDEVWKAANEKAYNDLTYNSGYSRIASPSNMGYVFYKILKKGTSTEPVYFTDTVKVYYTGTLITDSVFDSMEPPYSLPLKSAVSGFCDGFSAALQYMSIGDRWEIWLPQELGYGVSGTTTSSGKVGIPPYSTLKFEVEIVDVRHF